MHVLKYEFFNVQVVWKKHCLNLENHKLLFEYLNYSKWYPRRTLKMLPHIWKRRSFEASHGTYLALLYGHRNWLNAIITANFNWIVNLDPYGLRWSCLIGNRTTSIIFFFYFETLTSVEITENQSKNSKNSHSTFICTTFDFSINPRLLV